MNQKDKKLLHCIVKVDQVYKGKEEIIEIFIVKEVVLFLVSKQIKDKLIYH